MSLAFTCGNFLTIYFQDFKIQKFSFKKAKDQFKDEAKKVINALAHHSFPNRLDLLFAFECHLAEPSGMFLISQNPNVIFGFKVNYLTLLFILEQMAERNIATGTGAVVGLQLSRTGRKS